MAISNLAWKKVRNGEYLKLFCGLSITVLKRDHTVKDKKYTIYFGNELLRSCMDGRPICVSSVRAGKNIAMRIVVSRMCIDVMNLDRILKKSTK